MIKVVGTNIQISSLVNVIQKIYYSRRMEFCLVYKIKQAWMNKTRQQLPWAEKKLIWRDKISCYV